MLLHHSLQPSVITAFAILVVFIDSWLLYNLDYASPMAGPLYCSVSQKKEAGGSHISSHFW